MDSASIGVPCGNSEWQKHTQHIGSYASCSHVVACSSHLNSFHLWAYQLYAGVTRVSASIRLLTRYPGKNIKYQETFTSTLPTILESIKSKPQSGEPWPIIACERCSLFRMPTFIHNNTQSLFFFAIGMVQWGHTATFFMILVLLFCLTGVYTGNFNFENLPLFPF